MSLILERDEKIWKRERKKILTKLIIDTKFIVLGFNEFILMRIGLIKVNFEVKNKMYKFME
jgi:hypothetical protein